MKTFRSLRETYFGTNTVEIDDVPEDPKSFVEIKPTKKSKVNGKEKDDSITETKSAPKGFHFTKDGKLKRGDADADGDGGSMLRADPLDKQRSKVPPVSEESELGDLAHEKKMKHRFLVTYSDPNHTVSHMRKTKQMRHVLAPTSTKSGSMFSQGEAEPMVKKHMTKQGYKVHDIEHVGMVSKKVYESIQELLDDYSKVNEDTEQIDELKTGTLLRYHTKAGKSGLQAGVEASKKQDAGDYSGAIPLQKKSDKRMAGQKQAMGKIQKRYATEDVAQMDEVSDKTLQSYRSKAHTQIQHYKYAGGKDKPEASAVLAKREPGMASATARVVQKDKERIAAQPKREPQKASSYKPLGGRDELSGRSYSEEVELGEAKDINYHRDELKKTSDKIDSIVKSGGRVGLNDPLSVKTRTHQSAIKTLKQQKGVKEEIEQMDELKSSTLSSYVDKAADSARVLPGSGSNAEASKKTRRMKAISGAVARMSAQAANKKLKTEQSELEEAVSVSKQKYSWGKMVTVHHGSDVSYPLHPEHQKAIAKLGEGEKTSFKDETNTHVVARRDGDNIHLTQPRKTSKMTTVSHSHFTESADMLKIWNKIK